MKVSRFVAERHLAIDTVSELFSEGNLCFSIACPGISPISSNTGMPSALATVGRVLVVPPLARERRVYRVANQDGQYVIAFQVLNGTSLTRLRNADVITRDIIEIGQDSNEANVQSICERI